MDKYDWPKNIHCSTPKNKRENLIKIDDKLKNRVQMGLVPISYSCFFLKKKKFSNTENKLILFRPFKVEAKLQQQN